MLERVVEIDRNILVEEPWVTVRNGKRIVKPAIISSMSQLPRGHRVEPRPVIGGESSSCFRVVDESGPCYEFMATACLDDAGIALNIDSEGELRFLR